MFTCYLSWAFAVYNPNQVNIDMLEEQNENLNLNINELHTFFINYSRKDKNIEYYEKYLEKNKIQKQILNNKINILYSIQVCFESSNLCTYKTEFVNYNEILNELKILELITDIKDRIEIIEEDNIIKEKILYNLKQEESEKVNELKEKQIEKSNEYINKAKYDLNKWNFKDAISNYTFACQFFKTYDCLYWLWISYYELSKEYQNNITFYKYKQLMNSSKEEAIKNLNLAIEMIDNNDYKNSINKLINEINNYPVETKISENKIIIELADKDEIDKKVDLIFIKLDNLTKDLTEEKN